MTRQKHTANTPEKRYSYVFAKSKVRPSGMGSANGKQGFVTRKETGSRQSNRLIHLKIKNLKTFYFMGRVTCFEGICASSGDCSHTAELGFSEQRAVVSNKKTAAPETGAAAIHLIKEYRRN